MNTAKKGLYQLIGAGKVLVAFGFWVGGVMTYAWARGDLEKKETEKKENPYKRYGMNSEKF